MKKDFGKSEPHIKILNGMSAVKLFPVNELEEIAKLAKFICNTPIVFITTNDQGNQKIPVKIGIDSLNSPQSIFFCQHILQENEIYEVYDCLDHPLFSEDLWVLGHPKIRFFAAISITLVNKEKATLYVADQDPRHLSPLQKEGLFFLSHKTDYNSTVSHEKKNQENGNHHNDNEGLNNELEKIRKNIEREQKIYSSLKNKIKETEEKYKYYVEYMGDLIYEFDDNFQFCYINPTFELLLGYLEKDLLGKPCWEVMDSSWQKKVVEFYESQKKNKVENSYFEFPFLTKNGSELWVGQNVKIEFLENSKVYVTAIARNISIRKTAEDKLKENENRLEETQKIARLGGWEHDLSTQKVTWTTEVYHIHELPLNQRIQFCDMVNYFVAEAQAKLKTAMDALLKGGKEIDLELQMITAKNNKIWVCIKGKGHYKNGKIYKISGTLQDITDRKIAEIQLTRTLSRLSIIISYMNAGILVYDENKDIALVNQRFCDHLPGSAKPENIIGANFIAGLPLIATHFEDADEFLDRIEKIVLLQETVLNEEVYMVNGKVYERDFIPILENNENKGALLMIRDVSERKKNEVLLLNKQNELKAFVEAAPAAIAMFDNNMCYLAASEKWLEDYKIHERNFIGKSHYDLSPSISDEWKKIQHRCLNGAIESEDDDEFIREDGTILYMKWEIRPWLNIDGEIGGIVMFTEDITERKKQEIELRIAKEKAEEGGKAKEQFLSTMSHEIRTPMNAVLGITQILLEENPKPDQIENLKTLKFSANNLLVLINDILDYTKIEAGKITLEEVDFDLRELLQGIKQTLNFKAEDKKVKLKLYYEDDIPLVVKGDPVRLSQILTNLVGNAVKFTESGNVIIEASLNKKLDNGSLIDFSVTDTGIGIPRDKIDHIFERFSQASSDTTRKFGGTGLGLAITKKLLNLMESEINVESELGKGSKFYFTIKMGHGTIGQSVLMQEIFKVEEKDFQSLNVKLLLVEDNEVNQYVAKKFLNKWGIIPDCAYNGKEALEKVMANKYDIILMDIQMPEMDGYEATKAIREMEGDYFKKVPIIALTASVMLDVKDKVFTIGMSDFVTKPFNPDELYRKILSHLDKSKKQKLQSAPVTVPAPSPHKINAKIDNLANGDEEFKKELMTLYISSLNTLKEEYEECIKLRDLEKLRFVRHKHKSSVDILGVSDLYKELEDATLLLENPKTTEEEINNSINKVIQLSDKTILELESLLQNLE